MLNISSNIVLIGKEVSLVIINVELTWWEEIKWILSLLLRGFFFLFLLFNFRFFLLRSFFLGSSFLLRSSFLLGGFLLGLFFLFFLLFFNWSRSNNSWERLLQESSTTVDLTPLWKGLNSREPS